MKFKEFSPNINAAFTGWTLFETIRIMSKEGEVVMRCENMDWLWEYQEIDGIKVQTIFKIGQYFSRVEQ